MKTSAETNEISAALSKAQAEITNPSKDAVNPHFKSKYATLDGGLNVVREALSKAGASVTQTTRMDGDVMMLDTRIMSGNQWIEGEYPVCRFPAKQQEIGSALTYARRYSLFAIVGVAGEDDDDANAAATPTPAPVANVDVATVIATMEKFATTAAQVDEWWVKNKPTIQKLTKDQIDEIIAACSAKKNSFMNAEAA